MRVATDDQVASTCDQFLAAGFKEDHGRCSLYPYAKRRFSYWVYKDGRKAFMIYACQYCHDIYMTFSADAQFNIRGDDNQPVFNVVLLDASDPAQVIGFFTRVWDKMECAFYDD